MRVVIVIVLICFVESGQVFFKDELIGDWVGILFFVVGGRLVIVDVYLSLIWSGVAVLFVSGDVVVRKG